MRDGKGQHDGCAGTRRDVTHRACDGLAIVVKICLHFLPRLELQVRLLPLLGVQHDLHHGGVDARASEISVRCVKPRQRAA